MSFQTINRSGLYRLYYVLAAFDVFTIILSLSLNYQLVKSFQRSVVENQKWAFRLESFSQLALLAADVNAPGNDVFDNRDAVAERSKMQASKTKFDEQFNQLRLELKDNISREEFVDLNTQMDLINNAMIEMIVEANQIFEYFINHQSDQAAQRMAFMDRKYAVLNKAIESLRGHIRIIQRSHLEKQNVLAKKLSFYEYVIAFAVLLIVIFVVIYGRRLKKSFLKLEVENEKIYADLTGYKLALDEHSLVSISDLKGKIIYVNDKVCRISQYSRQELIGQDHKILNSGYHPREFWQSMWKTIAAGNIWRAEVKNRAKDGSYYWVNSTIIPFKDSQGKITQYFSIRTDITDKRKQEEEILKAKEEAEQANKAKSQFLANMSHEIRTPMTAVLGFSDLLTKTPLDEKQRGFVNTIVSSGGLLLAIINDILDFSKFQSGNLQLEAIDFDLEYLLGDSFKLIQSKISGKKIQTFIDIMPDVPRHFKGDPTRFKQVIINLLSNGIKFTEKGEVGVKVTLKEPWNEKAQCVLELRVIDTGIGIPKDKVNGLFQAFQQADQSTTRKYGGTGLGLAICKTLVEAMDGSIHIESEPGRGSQFVFTVRLRKADEASFNLQPLNYEELKGKRMFLVDDNDHARELLTRYLQEAGMSIVGAVESVPRALQLLESFIDQDKLPDLIISDIMMPDMDGHAFIQRIRLNHRTKDVKVLAVSSDIHIGVSRELQKEGFDGFLSKPYTRQELISVIATLLGVGYDRTKGEIITRHKAQEIHFNGIHLLVAEDVEVNQILMKEYIDALGCSVDFANNGQEAVEALKGKTQYALCLMDMQMPVMDGETATKMIRETISRDIPIIALTAAVLKEDEERCRAAGMNDFLTKPVNVEKLRSILQKYGRPAN